MLPFVWCFLIAPDIGLATPSKAREHYERALVFLDEEQLGEARHAFEQAYAESPHHVVLYNLGKVCLEMGDEAAAREYLERYLEEGGTQVPEKRRAEVLGLLRGLARSSDEDQGEGKTEERTGVPNETVPALEGEAKTPVGVEDSNQQHAEHASRDNLTKESAETTTPPDAPSALPSVLGNNPRAELHERNARRQKWRSVGMTLSVVGAGLAATAVGVGIWNQGRAEKAENAREVLSQMAPGGSIEIDDQDAIDEVLDYEVARARNEKNFASVRRFDALAAAHGIAASLFLISGLTLYFTHPKPVALSASGTSLRLRLAF